MEFTFLSDEGKKLVILFTELMKKYLYIDVYGPFYLDTSALSYFNFTVSFTDFQICVILFTQHST